MAEEVRDLDLLLLGEPPGLPALTVAMGRAYAEAAAVCLDDRKHTQGVYLQVKGLEMRRYALRWPDVDAQMRKSHNDLQDATRDGAYAVAIMLAPELTGYTVVEQSRKGTGFDYWLGTGDETAPFQARLEVSGILDGDDRDIKKRVAQKRKQPARSDSTGLPAFACVVEFGRPEAHFTGR